MQENRHSVIIEERKSLSVSGVECVSSFSEAKITLVLTSGDRLSAVGSGLKIVGFSKANGTFTAEGTITGVSYGGKSFAARLFK